MARGSARYKWELARDEALRFLEEARRLVKQLDGSLKPELKSYESALKKDISKDKNYEKLVRQVMRAQHVLGRAKSICSGRMHGGKLPSHNNDIYSYLYDIIHALGNELVSPMVDQVRKQNPNEAGRRQNPMPNTYKDFGDIFGV